MHARGSGRRVTGACICPSCGPRCVLWGSPRGSPGVSPRCPLGCPPRVCTPWCTPECLLGGYPRGAPEGTLGGYWERDLEEPWQPRPGYPGGTRVGGLLHLVIATMLEVTRLSKVKEGRSQVNPDNTLSQGTPLGSPRVLPGVYLRGAPQGYPLWYPPRTTRWYPPGYPPGTPPGAPEGTRQKIPRGILGGPLRDPLGALLSAPKCCLLNMPFWVLGPPQKLRPYDTQRMCPVTRVLRPLRALS